MNSGHGSASSSRRSYRSGRPESVKICAGIVAGFSQQPGNVGPRPYDGSPMAKAAAIQHACSECGYTTGKWLGKCPSCESWGTLVEERTAAAPKGGATRAAGKPLLRLVEVEAADAERIPTGV